MKQLQSLVASTNRHGEDVFKSLEVIIKSTATGQQDLEMMSNSLRIMAEELKSSNESLLSLKVSV